MNVFEDNSRSIGRTPLVRLRRIAPEGARVYAKIEGRNPGYSAKDRIGAAMIDAAEAQGLLKPGMEIVEPTSGNTGIALAFVAAARGYKLTLTMPESMSVERRKILKALGARLALTPAHLGMKGSIEKAEEILRSEPGKYYMPQQFENPANPDAHEHTTGPEIWNDTDGQVDVVVAGIGTGGTLTGVARYFKRRQGRKILAVGVEPAESATITQTLAGKPLQSGANRIQGLGAGFIPKTLDLTIVDRVETVTSTDAIAWARRLCMEEGILSGISCGAAAEAACRLAALPEFQGKTIVVILPDSGERYLSGPLFDGVFDGIETATAGTIL